MIDLGRAAASLYGESAPAAPSSGPQQVALAALTGAPSPARPAAPAGASPVPGARLVKDGTQVIEEPVDRAAALYGTPPVELAGQQPRLDEPDLAGAHEVAADLGLGRLAENIDAAELQQVREAVVAAELGHTTATAIMDAARQALHRQGGQPLSVEQLQASRVKCEAELRNVWGKSYDANMARARATFERAVAKAPALTDFMVDTGLANDPMVIRLLAERAAKRPNAPR